MMYHIILAEDERDVQDFLMRALARIQPLAMITPAANGVEALRSFQERGADLIISDHRMPEMSGLDLLRAVRAMSQVPFVLISADATVEAQALAAGVSEFLTKPVSLTQIRALVRQLLP